jgi:molybdopterin synthase catalytic subunit
MTEHMNTQERSHTSVSIQTADFDISNEVAQLRQGMTGVGAVCVFVGTVRDNQAHQRVSKMELEHYPGMTEKSIQKMMAEAFDRFELFGVRIVHRVGVLDVQEQVVLVAVTSAHRGQSFLACEFLMDYLKTQAPFWKKETTPEGAKWVDARVSDDEALKRWGIAVNNAVV